MQFDSTLAEFREYSQRSKVVTLASKSIPNFSRSKLEELYIDLLANHVLLLETLHTSIHRNLGVAPEEYNTPEKIEAIKQKLA